MTLGETLISTITPGQSGLRSNVNEEVLHIPKTLGLEPHHQIVLCHIQDTCFFLFLFFLAGGAYTSTEMKLAYSTALANWVVIYFKMNRSTREFVVRLFILQHVSDKLSSLQMLFLYFSFFLFFFFLKECLCACMCIYFLGFLFFSFISLFSLNNLR